MPSNVCISLKGLGDTIAESCNVHGDKSMKSTEALRRRDAEHCTVNRQWSRWASVYGELEIL